MRSKFTDLINQGVASFEYTPHVGELPEQDEICRMYNNIFSIPTDTHMSCIDDEVRVITGHMVATNDWNSFMTASNWGAVNFSTAGYWSLADFLFQHGLECDFGCLNNDTVAFVTPINADDTLMPVAPNTVTTSESNIPQQITVLTKSGNRGHILECFGGTKQEVIKKLNESSWVKGNNWVPTKNGIVGLVGDTTYMINLVNEAHEYRRYSLETKEYNCGISLTVWDCMFDKSWTAHINDIGKVTYYSETLRGDFTPVYNFLDKMNDCIKSFDWQEDLKCPMAYTITMPGPWAKKDWKLTEYPGYEIFMGVTSCGQLVKKKR